jgi:hypothetical protein
MLRILISVLIALEVLFLPAYAGAQSSGEGIISGKVINGTENGQSVEGTVVVLLKYTDDVLTENVSAVANGEGEFQFENIAAGHDYLVTANFMNVDYYYQVEFEEDVNNAYVEVWVCDTTTVDSDIQVGIRHIIVNVYEDYLEITEVIQIYNDGDRTYTGTDGVLKFTLPQEAYSFSAPQTLMQDISISGENIITYLVPLPPGELQLVYGYEIERTDPERLDFALVIDYPTDSFELLVGGENFEASSSWLTPSEPVYTETGERFIHYQGADLERSNIIYVSIFGLSWGGLPLVVIVCVVIVVIVAVIVFYLKRRKTVDNE